MSLWTAMAVVNKIMNCNKKLVLVKRCAKGISLGLAGVLSGLLFLNYFLTEAAAQVPPPAITSSGLNTQVSAPMTRSGGEIQHNITGGTRPGGGGNLFHSFGEFGVPTNNIANFLNDSGLPTSNILSRVTGGNPSNIFGTIQTQGFGNANLFLMNPAGIVFGSNASLNVGGSTHFTTADYLRLADGVRFTALTREQDAILSVAPVVAFGFLESNPAAISVDGSNLSVPEGKSLSLVGGDISIDNSSLTAPGGQIALASVGSPGEVLAGTYAIPPNINGEPSTAMGNITLSEGAVMDVSADAAGSVLIRGGQLMMTNAVISADTVAASSAPVSIDIDVTGDISISTFDGPALTARTSGTGTPGEVSLASGGSMNLSGAGSPRIVFSIIDTHTSGPGNAGNVVLTSQGDITVKGEPTNTTDSALVFLSDTGTDGFDTGKGGDLSITARSFINDNGDINTGNFASFAKFHLGAGPAGNVSISVAERIGLERVDVITDSFDLILESGFGSGDVTLNAQEIDLDHSQISTSGFSRAGDVSIITDFLTLSNDSQISSITRTEPGGMITIAGKVVELSNSQLVSTTRGNAPGGDITITVTERLSLLNLDDPSIGTNPSVIASNSADGSSTKGFSGPSGNIRISAPFVDMTGGSKINTVTGSSGTGGQVSITDAREISISGQTAQKDVEDTINFGQFQASGIFTGSIGGNCSGGCGDSGPVNITTQSLVIEKGGQINSSTTTEGKGGLINVNSSGNISITGTLKDGTPGGILSQTTGVEPGSGAGGNVLLTAGQNFTLSNGATVSASSSGSGNAGDINVTARDTILLDKATVTTEATTAFGGNIKLTADNQIQLNDSQVTSRVQAGSGSAGSINFDPDFIVLKNSKVLSTAEFGDGGPIKLIANSAILIDSFSELNADSQFGGSGTIDIRAPVQFLSGTIAPLPQNPAPVTALYGTRCVAGEGGHFSTFVDSKVDSLAPPPGTFLASPFLPLANSPSVAAQGHGESPSKVSEPGHAALLQLAAYSPPVLFGQDSAMLTACP